MRLKTYVKLFVWTVVIIICDQIIAAQDRVAPGIRTREELTILTANDGRTHVRVDANGRRDAQQLTPDSITVIQLGPNHAPLVKTVYGTVPNSIASVPYLPMTPDGRYGFVSSRGAGGDAPDLVSVIDLASPDLTVVQKIQLAEPRPGVMHPDGRHLVVPYASGLSVFEILAGRLTLVKDNPTSFTTSGIDISPRGDRIVGIERGAPDANGNRISKTVHVFSYNEGLIEHLTEVKIKPGLPGFDCPFAPRFSPDGSRVLVLNGGGNGSKGKLDDVLSIDMTTDPPSVTEAVHQVADGMEAVAFHPRGAMAVIACLEDTSTLRSYSHLAVIDLASKPMRLLYELNIEATPQGIEFSPDGTQLFVQIAWAHHITVFDVEGYLLRRSPFVIRVGHGPAAMGIRRRYSKR